MSDFRIDEEGTVWQHCPSCGQEVIPSYNGWQRHLPFCPGIGRMTMAVICRKCGVPTVRSTWVQGAGHLCPDCSADSLDAAWAEAEAALPDRLRSQIGVASEPGLIAHAWAEDVTDMQTLAEADGPTPAAALRALVVALRERAG